MGNRRISDDLKVAAMNLYDRRLLRLTDILDCVGFSRRTFQRVRKLWRQTGWVSKEPSVLRGRPRLLHCDDLQYILQLVQQRPDWFLDELLRLLEKNRFISVHYTTIHRALEKAGVSRKKLRKIAIERNELLRGAFINQIAQYNRSQLCWIDEVSKDDRTYTRGYGRSQRNRRSAQREKFVRGIRVSGTGCLSEHGMIGSWVTRGSMTQEKILQFLREEVVRYSDAIS